MDGLTHFRHAFKGDKLKTTVTKLLPESELRLRIRAYNKAGPGEWSEVTESQTEKEEEEERIPLTELPDTWCARDSDLTRFGIFERRERKRREVEEKEKEKSCHSAETARAREGSRRGRAL